MTRKAAAVLLALMLMLSGCAGIVDTLSGDESNTPTQTPYQNADQTFEAQPAKVPDQTVSESEYAYKNHITYEYGQNATLQNGERGVVTAKTSLVSYNRSEKIAGIKSEVSGVSVFTTPTYMVGNTSNQYAEKSSPKRFTFLVNNHPGFNYLKLKNLQNADKTEQVEILGEQRTAHKFTASAKPGPFRADVILYSASFKHEGDIVVVVGLYGERFSDHKDPVFSLMKNVKHPVNNSSVAPQ